jgi:hypothetical protein
VVLLDEMLRVVEEARVDGATGATEAPVDGGADATEARVDDGAVATEAAAREGSGASRKGAAAGWTIATAKFLQPVRPGDELTVEHEALASGAVRFAIRSGGRAVATGTLVPRLEVTERDHGHQAG